MADEKRRRLVDGLVATLLGGGAFTLYTLTLAPTVLAGDAGEFQFVPYLLGVAHPTGYPLYCLLGWLWSHVLWFGDVAYRMNLFSAFWAALAVALLYRTTFGLLKHVFPDLSVMAQRLLAVLASATFAVTPTFWSQAIIAEVYSLHIFLLLLIFYLLLTLEPVPQGSGIQAGGGPEASLSPAGGIEGERRLLLTAFILGLGLSHHRATVLLVPGVLVYVWVARPRFFRSGRLSLKSLLLVLLPLVLYLIIPLRAPQTPYLRLPLDGARELVLHENTAAGFLDFALGGPFGGSVDLTVDLPARLSMAWGFVRGEMGWIGLALAAVGVAWLTIRRRWPPLMLTGLAFVCLVAFNLVYTIGDIHVLYIPVYLIMVLWLALGAGALAQVLAEVWSRVSQGSPSLRAGSRKGRVMALVPLAVVLPLSVLPLWMAAVQYSDLDQSRNTADRQRWKEILAEPLQDDAILVSNDRDEIMPMWFLQYVGSGRESRTGLLGLFPLITPDYPTLGRVLDLGLSTGRPLYLIKEMPGIEIKVAVEAEGSLWRVLGLAAAKEPDHPHDALVQNIVALSGYDQTPRNPHPGGPLTVSLYWEVLHPPQADYHSFVHLVDSTGQKVAQSDHQPGGAYYPATLWQPGEQLRDDHTFDIPADVSPGVYRLLAGLYSFHEDGTLAPLGDPVDLGQVGVEISAQAQRSPIDFPVAANLGPILPTEP